MPQRHRHLLRSRAPCRYRGLQRQIGNRVVARLHTRRDRRFRRFRGTRGGAVSAAARRGRLRRADPRSRAHRFNTPSGKIEVYHNARGEADPYGLGAMPPIPAWVAPPGPDPAFPLMLCSPKSRARTHSTHGNQPGLARVDPDDVWLNAEDAADRGIGNGQRVRIFNAQGATMLPAFVTDRIAGASCRSRKAPGSRRMQPGPTRKAVPTCWPPTGRRLAARQPITRNYVQACAPNGAAATPNSETWEDYGWCQFASRFCAVLTCGLMRRARRSRRRCRRPTAITEVP